MRSSQAVILIGHGSRAAEANEALARLAELTAQRLGLPAYPAHLSLGPPSLADALDQAAAGGACHVVVCPVFLAGGSHVRRDIPELLAKARAAHPGLTIVLAEPLGADAALADLLARARRALLAAGGGAVMGELLWGRPDGRTAVDVHEVDIPLPDWPAALDGLRLAVLSDLHYGRFVFEPYTRRLVELVNASTPDLILLPGDTVNHLSQQVQPAAALLGGLRAPLGVWASLGNHDYYAAPRTVARGLEAAGIRVLVNQHVRLTLAGAEFILAGVDDRNHGRPDVRAALDGAAGALPVVLLSHNPDVAEELDSAGRVDLMVSGHTHGGQITLFGRPVVTRTRHRRYWRGLVRGPRCWVYTSRGVGMVGVPLRIGSRPEVPILRLPPRVTV